MSLAELLPERRSWPSRVYRAANAGVNLRRLAIVGLSAWTLVLAATPIPVTDAEAASYWRFFVASIAAVVGILTIFGAGLALGSRYVAEPAARRVLKEHTDKGAASHPELISRLEWDTKHELLRAEIEAVKATANRLSERVDTKATSRGRA